MANIEPNEIGYNENTTANPLMVQYRRATAAPLDISSVFTSREKAAEYAVSGSTAYAGQLLSVVGESDGSTVTEAYVVTHENHISELMQKDDSITDEEIEFLWENIMENK